MHQFIEKAILKASRKQLTLFFTTIAIIFLILSARFAEQRNVLNQNRSFTSKINKPIFPHKYLLAGDCGELQSNTLPVARFTYKFGKCDRVKFNFEALFINANRDFSQFSANKTLIVSADD